MVAWYRINRYLRERGRERVRERGREREKEKERERGNTIGIGE